jgi:hypothetical protein
MTASEPPSPENERQEPGLWLWHGEAPAQNEALPPIQPLSRAKRITDLLVSAGQRARRLASPNGPALIALALLGSAAWAMLYLLPSGEPVRGIRPVSASPPIPRPGVIRAASPVPSTAVAIARLAPVPAAPASIAQTGQEPIEHKTGKSRAWHRSRHVKRAHAAFVHLRTPVYWEPCRYQCDWAGSITWHGGGY